VIPLDFDRVSAYVRVTSALRGRITRKEWPIGAQIPSIAELCKHYRVSRTTLRQALDVLRIEGLIVSGRGIGTRVAKLGPDRQHNRKIVSNPLADHVDLKIKVLSRERVTVLPDTIFGSFSRYAEYTHIRKIHMIRDVPVVLADIFLETNSYNSIPSGADEASMLSRLVPLHSSKKFVSWWQEMSISYPDFEVSQLLKCSMTSPLVVMRRRRFDESLKILIGSQLQYRGDMFVYEIDGDGDVPGSKTRSLHNIDTEQV
jgi:GntR family transcriptional regulator